MGFFKNLFKNSEPDYQNIDLKSDAGKLVQSFEERLLDMAEKNRDRIDVVPDASKLYIIVGRPPAQFNLICMENSGRTIDLKSHAKDKLGDAAQVAKIFEALSQAYEGCREEARFRYILGMRSIIVTPSEKLAKAIDGIVTGAAL